MNAGGMTCDEAEALLPLVSDGALDERSDPTLFAHLGTCDRCQESLANHDLVGVALAKPAASAPKPVLRPSWHRYVPTAAAALLAVGVGGWFAARPAPPLPAEAPVARAAKAAPAATAPVAIASKPAALAAPKAPEPIHIDVEVVAVPGSTSAHPRYLVRKGDQVLLVDPADAAQEAPADAKPASYATPRRY